MIILRRVEKHQFYIKVLSLVYVNCDAFFSSLKFECELVVAGFIFSTCIQTQLFDPKDYIYLSFRS